MAAAAAAISAGPAAFSSRSLSFGPPRRPFSFRSPSSLLKSLPLAVSIRQKPSRKSTPKSPILFVSSRWSSRSFNVSANVAESDPKTINGDDENIIQEDNSEEEVDQKDLPDMKTLIQAYKKAILDGDQKSIDEIEAAIAYLEKKKNDLSLKFKEMTAEIASGKVKLIRVKADFENYRKKFDQDRLTFTSDIQGDLIESLLPMVDSFEETKQEIKPETEKEKKIETSYQGIYKQFVEVMRSMRVSVVETVGKPFDPAIHEVVAREESHQFKAGIISQELRRGFLVGDRLLRTATVKVSSGPGPVKVNSTVDESTQQQEVAAEAVPDATPSTNES